MRRTRLAAALVGIGTAATLVLPVSGAFADPGWNRPAPVQARRDDRDGGNWGRGGGYGRPDYDRGGSGRYDARGRYDRGRYDRRDDRDDRRWRDRDRDRYDDRYSRNDTGRDLGLLIGGAVLGAIIAGRH